LPSTGFPELQRPINEDFRLKLDKVTNIVAIAVLALAGQIGTKRELPSLDNSGRLNLVVAMTSTCHYCNARLPFYRRLNHAAEDSHGYVTLQFASPEPVETTRSHLAENDLPAPRILSSPLKSTRKASSDTSIVGSSTRAEKTKCSIL
jgi:hypothetical protein